MEEEEEGVRWYSDAVDKTQNHLWMAKVHGFMPA